MVHIENSCWLVLRLSLSIFLHVVNSSQSFCFGARSITISLFFFSADICKKSTSTVKPYSFPLFLSQYLSKRKKMSSKEFSPKSFSKNIETLKCSIMRCHSPSCIRSSDELWDESESTRDFMLWYQNQENGGEAMTFDNIIRLTLDTKGVPKFLFTLKPEGVTKLFESFRYESPYFLDKC